MEDALRDSRGSNIKGFLLEVLILVLMEDALRAQRTRPDRLNTGVLILVLMEDALRAL